MFHEVCPLFRRDSNRYTEHNKNVSVSVCGDMCKNLPPQINRRIIKYRYQNVNQIVNMIAIDSRLDTTLENKVDSALF